MKTLFTVLTFCIIIGSGVKAIGYVTKTITSYNNNISLVKGDLLCQN